MLAFGSIPIGPFRAALLLCLLLALAGCGAGQAPPSHPELPEPALRRLTEAQYINAIEDLFGADLFVPAGIEPDLRVRGLYSVGASLAAISPRGVEGFERASYTVAAQVMEVDRRERVVSCTPDAIVDPDCARAALAPLARRAWRRTVDEDELEQLIELAGASAQALGDFYQGLEFALATVLQYPDFLYRVELGNSVAGDDGTPLFDDFELASRLSFLLWNSIPDEELLDLAERGELSQDLVLDQQLDRMLSSERARKGLRAWFADLLHLADLDELYKDSVTFVHMSDTLGASAREETLLLFEDIVFDQDRDLREILTTRETFLNRELATLYAVQAPVREGFAPYDFGAEGQRRGLLNHASLLTLNSHPASSSPTLRGLFIREVLLCQVMPGAPAGVDTSIPPPSEVARTLRDRVQQHLTDPACGGCHRMMDLLGLGLENFDGIGVYRSQDNGADIDASGEFEETEFANHIEMAELVAQSEDFSDCMTTQVFRAALGQAEEPGQNASLDWLQERFAAHDYRLLLTLKDLLMSPLFRQAGELHPAGPEPVPPEPGIAPAVGLEPQLPGGSR